MVILKHRVLTLIQWPFSFSCLVGMAFLIAGIMHLQMAWSRSEIEVRQCEKQEIQIFSFLWASGNSWLQSHADCKTTTVWAESLRDAFYVISLHSNRDESPFILNFATECSCWVEKCSCGDHLRLKALSKIAVGDDRCYGYPKHWDCAHQGMMFARWAEGLRNQSLSTDNKVLLSWTGKKQRGLPWPGHKEPAVFFTWITWSPIEDFLNRAECRAEHAIWNSSDGGDKW